MKLYSSSVWILLTAATLSSTNAATCKRLTDPTNSFTVGFTQMTQTSVDEFTASAGEVLKTIDTQYPWLSTCAATLDLAAISASATSNKDFTTCMDRVLAIPSLDPGVSEDDPSFEAAIQKLLLNSVCTYYKDQIIPCSANVFIKMIVDAMNNGGSCCDAMKAQIMTNFGADLATTVDTLLKRIGNVLCSQRTYIDAKGSSMTQSCAVVLIKSVSTPPESLLQMIQLPSAETCKAMKGDQYTTTTGGTDQFGWKNLHLEPLGSCYEPLGSLAKTIGDYPVIAQTATLGDLFAPGKCVKGQTMLDYITNIIQTNTASIDTAYGVMGKNGSGEGGLSDDLETSMQSQKDVWSSKCFHIANGQSCDYGATQKLTVPYNFTTFVSTSNEKDKSTASSTTIMSLTALVGVVIAAFAL